MVRSDSDMVGPRDVLCDIDIRPSRIRRIAHRSNTHWIVDSPDQQVVLRRYASDRSPGNVVYELRLLEHLDGRGWLVPTPAGPMVEVAGSIWCVFRYMAGRAPAPRSVAGVRTEQRRRGRLLARLHADMADLVENGQREGWRRADEGLFDRTGKLPVDEILAQYERESPEEGRILRTYASQMRDRLSELLPYAPAPVVIHGDFTPWNIRYAHGALSAVLDFEIAHLDLRVADFALSWRGKYRDVVRGYEEVSPLERAEPKPEDLNLIPVARDDVARRTRRFDEVMAALGEALSPDAWGVVQTLHRDLADDDVHLVVCHGDLNPGNVLSAERVPWLAIDPLPQVADAAYDAASLVWARRPWLLEQSDPSAVLNHRIRVAAQELLVDRQRVRAWTLVRLVGILADRHAWGGFEESSLIRVAELMVDL